MIEHFWQARLVTDGPFIGVRTFFGPPLIDGEHLDRSPRWQAVVRDETTGRRILLGDECPIEVDGVFLRNIEKIKEADYRFLISHANYATTHRPDMPDANPHKPVDWMKLKPF